MTYCTLAQLTDRYGEQTLIDLTDRATPPAGVVDTDVIDRALADTDALIDGYLAARYTLPLATTPDLVATLAQEIAVYKLHSQVAPEKITQDYKDAIKTLEKISGGTIRLEVAGVEPETAETSGVQTNNPERPFTAATMKGFI